MKKSVGIGAGVAVVVVVGAWVGTTWYTGKRIEEASTKRLAEVNAFLDAQYPYLGLKVTADRYERGVFGTDARYVLLSSLSPDPAKPIRFDFDTHITHGPFPGTLVPNAARVKTSVAQNDTTKPIFDITKGAAPLVANALVAYGGDTKYDWSMPAVEIAREGRTATFSGAKGAGKFDREKVAIDGDMRIDLIKAQGTAEEANTGVEMRGIGARFDSRQGKFGLSIGTADMTLERLVVTTKDPKMGGSLDNGSYRVKIDENDKFINIEAAYAAGAMKFGTVDLGSAQAVIKLGQLDGSALKVLSDFYAKLPSAVAMGSAGNEDVLKDSMTKLMGSGQQLLAANPTFSLDPLVWKTDKGEQRVTLSMQFDRLPIEQSAEARDVAFKAVKRMDATVSLSKLMAQDLATKLMVEHTGVPAADAQKLAAEQIEQGVAMAQMMEFAKLEGDNLVSRISYVDGVLDINGKKTPIAEFADQMGVNKLLEQDDDSEEEGLDESDSEFEEAEAEDAAAADEATDAAPTAGRVMNRVNTAVMGDILDDEGFTYTVDTDGSGDPKIDVDPGDTGARSIEVEYYNCTGRSCEDFLMKARFRPSKGATLKVINEFNRENRWVRVYLDDDNTPMVEMDVNADGGLGKKSLGILVGLFFSTTRDFAEAIKPATAVRGR